jgi:hypothetical protein
MHTRLLMRASAGFMGGLGLAAIFMPQEIATYMSAGSSGLQVLLVQIVGALYFGFAILNWMAQGNLIGGIYSRPVTIGNLTHFVVATLALLKGALSGIYPAPVIAAVAVYGLFAVLFGCVAFGGPAAANRHG